MYYKYLSNVILVYKNLDLDGHELVLCVRQIMRL